MPNILPFEKEIIREYDNGERAVLADLTKLYEEALEKVNEKIAALMGRMGGNAQHVIYQVEYQKAVKTQIQAILEQLQADEFETVSEYLTKSYEDGFVGTMYALHQQGMPFIFPIDQEQVVKAIRHDTHLTSDLYTTLGLDLTKLKKTISQEISRGIASNMLYPEITGNVSRAAGIPLRRARTIVRTESGRIQEQATMDAAERAAAKGADLIKQWSAYRDMKTRATHRLLDGQIRELDEPFSVHGKTAMQPHGFGIAAEDCNCRCTSLIRPRSSLDEEEYERLQAIAAKHGLLVKDSKKYGHAKAKDFADFKKKYLKAAESLEKSGESSKIKEGRNVVSEAIKNGEVSTVVKESAQNRHIKSSGGYIEGRSYLSGTLEDAQALIDALAGTGQPVMKPNGEWNRRERVKARENIGVSIDPETGNETETRNAMIHYSKKGSHIVPRK